MAASYAAEEALGRMPIGDAITELKRHEPRIADTCAELERAAAAHSSTETPVPERWQRRKLTRCTRSTA
jgi:hypothetical protein